MYILTQWRESLQECRLQTLNKLFKVALAGVLRGYRRMWDSGLWLVYVLLLAVTVGFEFFSHCFDGCVLFNVGLLKHCMSIVWVTWWLLLVRPIISLFNSTAFFALLARVLCADLFFMLCTSTLLCLFSNYNFFLVGVLFSMAVFNVGIIFWPLFFADSKKTLHDFGSALKQSCMLVVNTLPLALFILIGLLGAWYIFVIVWNILYLLFFKIFLCNIFFVNVILNNIEVLFFTKKLLFFLINNFVVVPLISSFIVMYYIYTVYSHVSLYVSSES